MLARNIDATIIPQSDPHQSEYLPDHWQIRRFFSGFTGSAGSLVVTRDDARLWTDSRYFIQAEEQLDGTGIKLIKSSLPDTPTIDQFLADSLPAGSTVGINGALFSIQNASVLRDVLATKGIKLSLDYDPAITLWLDRPQLPTNPVMVYPVEHDGATADVKIERLREFITENKADAILISALDEIAWTLNIRGNDVLCNPVVIAYLYVSQNSATLFINERKITPDAADHLMAIGVKVAPYESLPDFLASVVEPVVIIDPATTSALSVELLGNKVLPAKSPVPLWKAIKNSTEITGFKAAMVRDGVALVKAHMELERLIYKGCHVDEMSVCEIWRQKRSEQPLFFSESFETIAGYGPHGAIVHYSPTPQSASAIGTDSLLLIDSGAQYLDGTTDITRTICLGIPTHDQRHHFTLVLQGNINLARTIFPSGTRGAQLDIMAHEPLWREGLSYLHGTGHGVGHFLSVHEGPHQIRMNDIPTPLRAGMIVTDEPGLYLEGRYGIRCENMLLVVPAMKTDMGEFLKFEVLTLFPFDRKLIQTSILTDEQLQWLNDYHRRVFQTLSPFLNPDEREWLAAETRPIIK